MFKSTNPRLERLPKVIDGKTFFVKIPLSSPVSPSPSNIITKKRIAAQDGCRPQCRGGRIRRSARADRPQCRVVGGYVAVQEQGKPKCRVYAKVQDRGTPKCRVYARVQGICPNSLQSPL